MNDRRPAPDPTPRWRTAAATLAIVAVSFGGLAAASATAARGETPRYHFPLVDDIEGELVRPDPPAAEALLRDVGRLFTASSRAIVARMTVRRGRGVHTVAFSLWTQGSERALLRVRAPQRVAGRAVLRLGDAAWTWDPTWGRLASVGPLGERARWGQLLFRIIDVVVGDPVPERYEPVAVRPAGSEGAAWTLALRSRTDRPVRCPRLEVDVTAGEHTLLEARCWLEDGEPERWRFGRHRDFGGLMLPTEVIVEALGDEGWSATFQLLRFGLETPVDDGLFTLTALQALR